MKPGKVLSVVTISGSEPPSVSAQLLCSVCGAQEWVKLSRDDVEELKGKKQFYSVCSKHAVPQPTPTAHESSY